MLFQRKGYRRFYNFCLRQKHEAGSTFKLLFADLLHNRVLDDSAGMLYATVVSIVPFFITLFPFLRAMGAFESIYDAVVSVLAGVVGESNSEYIVYHLKTYVMNDSSLGFYGFLVYSFSAVLLVNKLKKLFNKVYRISPAESSHNLLFNFFRYLVYIIAFALFLAFLSFIWSFFMSSVGPVDGAKVIGSVFLRKLLFYLIIAISCCFLFQEMPKVYVSGKSAISGSVFFVAELFLLNAVMALVSRIAVKSMSLVYGYAADVLIAFMWVNFFWKIFIVAVDLSYIIQYKPDASKSVSPNVSSYLQDSIEIMHKIVSGFKMGKGGEYLNVIASELSISSQQVIEICDKFVDAKLIHAVGKLKKRLYSPALPTNEIKVFYVLKAVQGDASSRGIGSRIVNRIREDQMNSFLMLSVEDLK
ncbi:MAG TPA: hypothetical protein DCO86_02010 [Spirochaetaceae bacterium]|nr:hypothetical protein [Spirochaetaceae bacterium]